jgi:predicted DNA-binding protein (MmcQ/YjbR family)
MGGTSFSGLIAEIAKSHADSRSAVTVDVSRCGDEGGPLFHPCAHRRRHWGKIRERERGEEMELDSLRRYLLEKRGAVEEYPFGPETPVCKVGGKMFALIFFDGDLLCLNLKSDPDHARVLREFYPAVLPGYHMNKRHWNTVLVDGSIPEDELQSMIDDSYALVVAGLSREAKKGLD